MSILIKGDLVLYTGGNSPIQGRLGVIDRCFIDVMGSHQAIVNFTGLGKLQQMVVPSSDLKLTSIEYWRKWNVLDIAITLHGRQFAYIYEPGAGIPGTIRGSARSASGNDRILLSFPPQPSVEWFTDFDQLQSVAQRMCVDPFPLPKDRALYKWSFANPRVFDLVSLKCAPVISHFPHTCPRCGAVAYVGIKDVDCSAKCHK